MARGRLHKRYKKKHKDNPAPRRSNPPLLTDLAEFAIPGFGGFVGTRFLTYVTATQVAKRWPQYAKHVGVGASIAAFLSTWFLAHKVKFLEKYHTPLVVGAAIATGQTIMQTYAPSWLGWMVDDPNPVVADLASGQQASSSSAQVDILTQNGLQLTDEDPSDFVMNDSYDAGIFDRHEPQARRHHGPSPVRQQAAQQPAQTQASQDTVDDDDLLNELTMQEQTANGSLGGGLGN